MPKPKKDKRVTFEDGEFRITTTVHLPGARSRTIVGKPWVQTTPDTVRVGCINFSVDAIYEILKCMSKQIRSEGLPRLTHQVGNYGDPE